MPVYDAFISYSHAKDMAIATALQREIQTLGKPWYRRRSLRVFRDDTGLSATPHLWPSIEEALGQSRFLILLASPEAATSWWVDREAAYWVANKSIDTLLIALTSGTLSWNRVNGDFQWSNETPLPAALKGRSSAEPRWIELQSYRGEVRPRDAKFQELAANFAATIRGIPKEDLLSQEIRQQRRALRHALIAAGLLLVLTFTTAWQWRSAVAQRHRAESTLAAATETANAFVADVAVRIRNEVGIPIKLASEIVTRARDLLNKLSEAGGSPAEVRRGIAHALRELATTLLIQGDTSEALKAAERSRDIMLDLVKDSPGDVQSRRELSLSRNRVGEALARAGNHDGALNEYRLALKLRDELVQSDPKNKELQRDLAVSHERIGDEQVAREEIDEALASYRKALETRKELADADPGNKVWARDLAVNYEKVGDMLLRTDGPEAALENFDKSLHIRVALATDTANAEAQRDVAVSLARIGDVQLRMGRAQEAMASYRRSLAVRQKLASSDSGNALWQSDLIAILLRLIDAGDDAPARFAHAADIARRLEAEGKLPSGLKSKLDEMAGELKKAATGVTQP
jgi:tetratricopeptide (TPR) repeat protein